LYIKVNYPLLALGSPLPDDLLLRVPSLLLEGLLVAGLCTLCGAEERGACSTFLRTGCDLSLIVLGALLCEERTAGCCCVCVRTVPGLATVEGCVLVLSLRSANCLLTSLLLPALVLAEGRCVVARSLLPEAERSVKVLEGLDVAPLLLPEIRPDELRGEPEPLSLITEGREDVFALLVTFLSEGLALLNLLTGADCAFLLYDTALRLSLVTTSLRRL
jgi:hypothetical protein